MDYNVGNFVREIVHNRLPPKMARSYDRGINDCLSCYAEIMRLGLDRLAFEEVLATRLQALKSHRPATELGIAYDHGVDSCARANMEFPMPRDPGIPLIVKRWYNKAIRS